MKKRLSLHEKAVLAMEQAVRKVIERHRITKRPLAVWDWEKNKVKYISPGVALRNFNRAMKAKKTK